MRKKIATTHDKIQKAFCYNSPRKFWNSLEKYLEKKNYLNVKSNKTAIICNLIKKEKNYWFINVCKRIKKITN